ncbi:hypothetical protein SAMN02745225_01188 [Ferrithrix thermotolerans DSM 19514]|uniref:Uncharacterized protein n=1 Tax=Ferrithrix thermotolerans DSM 19514 TaxID=1121881 RepID=A0A1M4V546_9ACTN|nr:hypothetical protein SAMN02745225_01188 [Ferrithrix thermotolerans DSM 19514]
MVVDREALVTKLNRKGLRADKGAVVLGSGTKYLLALVLLLAVGLVIQSVTHVNQIPSGGFQLAGDPLGAEGLSMPVVTGPTNATTAWYCSVSSTGTTASPPLLEIDNASKVSSRVEMFSSLATKRPIRKFTLGPYASFVLSPSIFGSSKSFSGVALVAKGGRVVAAESVSLGSQVVKTPCQTSPGFFWLVSGLYTLAKDAANVSIYNPFATPAVVDLSALTSSGAVVPGNFQGVIVDSGQTKTINLDQVIPPTANLAIVVRARSGRVVVGSLQTRSDRFARGVAVPQATIRPSTYWNFPYVRTSQSSSSEVTVVNPSSSLAKVRIKLVTSFNRLTSVLPGAHVTSLVETVPPFSTASVGLSGELAVPSEGVYGVQIRSLNSVGVGVSLSSALDFFGNMVFVEPYSTPIYSNNWLVVLTFRSSYLGSDPLAISLPKQAIDPMEVSTISTTSQNSSSSPGKSPLKRQSTAFKERIVQAPSVTPYTVVSSGVLDIDVKKVRPILIVRGASPLAIQPAYSANGSIGFLSVPIN